MTVNANGYLGIRICCSYHTVAVFLGRIILWEVGRSDVSAAGWVVCIAANVCDWCVWNFEKDLIDIYNWSVWGTRNADLFVIKASSATNDCDISKVSKELEMLTIMWQKRQWHKIWKKDKDLFWTIWSQSRVLLFRNIYQWKITCTPFMYMTNKI